MPTGRRGSLNGNIGADADAFVGRARELERLAATFAGGARIVTLHGPGGIGKTRLARRFARVHGGAWLASLAGARDARDVEVAVALALGVPARGRDDVGAAIAESLRARGETLVVLDDCEGVAAHVAAALGAWLDRAPETRWITTSRELLRAPGEHVFELEPLEEEHAVELFVARARASHPEFTADPELLLGIVRRLEAMPLAIELAAARTRVLDARGLYARLLASDDVLGAAVDRRRSLRAAIAWSWELLSPEEQRALAQCSVFRGGFDLDAAEAVLDVGAPAVDVVSALRDKSLVRAYEPEGFPGDVRLGTYESVRAFAEEALRASGEERAMLDRHARYYLRVGTAWEAETWHGAVESPRKLALDLDNLLAVHERAAAAEGSRDVLSAAIALFPVFATRGPFAAFLALADPARDDPRLADAPKELAARYLLVRGRARQLMARRAESLADFRAALAAARASGEPRLVARALVHVGTAERLEGLASEARDRFEAALRLFEEERDERAIAVVLSAIGAIDLVTGALDRARPVLLRAIDALARLGDQATRAMVLIDMGIVEQERGDFAAAEAAFDEAMREHRRSDNRRFYAMAAIYRAGLDDEAGRPDDARARYEETRGIAEELGDPKLDAMSAAGLAAVLARAGESALAEAACARAERRAREQGEPRIVASVLLHRARVLAARGDLAAAEQKKAFAVGLVGSSDDVRFALRMLDRELGGRATTSAAAVDDALVVGQDADFFRPPGGARVDLGRRLSLKRLLMTLAWRRVEAPGAPVARADLVAAGWPSERLDDAVATNRLNVAIAELRKRGLRDVLVRRDGGLLLDPGVPLVVGRDP